MNRADRPAFPVEHGRRDRHVTDDQFLTVRRIAIAPPKPETSLDLIEIRDGLSLPLVYGLRRLERRLGLKGKR
jgi:hypothetical protein